MYRISRIIIENFRLIENFDSDPEALGGSFTGLIFMGGENNDVPNATSNGAGKSTFGNAITWCTHGCDLAGQNLTDVISYGESECHVRLFLFDDETRERVQIWRRRDKNKFEGRTVTVSILKKGPNSPSTQFKFVGTPEEAQPRIDELLGQRGLFLAAHVFGYNENTKPFALRSDQEQKQLFDLIIEAEDLDRALARTLSEHSATNTVFIEAERVCTSLAVKREATSETLQHQLEEQRSRLNKLEAKEARLKKKFDLLTYLHKGASAINDYVFTYTDMIRSEIDEMCNYTWGKCNGLRAALDIRKEMKRDAEVMLEKLRGDDCPTECDTCGQEITELGIKRSIEKAQHAIEKLVYEIAELEESLSQEIRQSNELIPEAKELDEYESELRTAATRTLGMRLLFNDKMNALASEKKSTQLFVTLTESKLSKSAESLVNDIERAERKRDDLKKKLDRLNFLKKAFGRSGIRAYRLDLITPELNEIAANYSNALFGDGTKVRYSTQKELKSGDYKEAFNVSVFDKDGTLHEVCSAGEAMRRDIVHTFTMAELAERMGKRTISFMLFDEAFRSLDLGGTSAVMGLLNSATQSTDLILVVEHNEEMKSMFDKALTVVRKKGKSTVEWSEE